MNKEFFCHQNVSAKLYRIGVFFTNEPHYRENAAALR